jgi:hypothetical protein
MNTDNDWLYQRTIEALALIRKGGLSAKIARAFLKTHFG